MGQVVGTIRVEPLDATFGAVVRDVLLARASDAIIAELTELWLEYAYEKQSGNRSPAATVAPGFGMKEDTVRQAARRARQRLRTLAARDERFAPLATLPLLA